METHKLIENLVKQNAPVERLRSPKRRLIAWASIATIILISEVFFIGVRRDFGAGLFHVGFLVETLISLLVILFSASAAFRLSAPGRDVPGIMRNLPFLGLGLWFIFLALNAVLSGWHFYEIAEAVHVGSDCGVHVVWLGALPAGILFWMVKNGAPLRAAKAGALSLLAGSAMGSLAMQFHCRGLSPFHSLLWHFGPVLVLVCLGSILGDTLLRWKKDRTGPLVSLGGQ